MNSYSHRKKSPQHLNNHLNTPNHLFRPSSPLPISNKYMKQFKYNPLENQQNESVVKQEYDINHHEKQQLHNDKSRSWSNKKDRYSDIYKKYRAKLEVDAEQHSKELRKKRSTSPKISVISSRSISNNSRSGRRLTTETVKKRPTFRCISSQKYIKLNLEQLEMKKKREYQQKIENLMKEVEIYKNKYENSLKALNKINKFIQNQKHKHENERHVYQEKIKLLRAQLSSKPAFGNIPHLYTYKEYNQQKMVPDSLILQNHEQNRKSQLSDRKQSSSNELSKIEILMEDLLAKPSSKSSSGLKSNLSLESK